MLVNPTLITFSANDLAAYIGVDRQTIYRMRASGRLPRGFLIGKRIRRWSLPELINHSDELKAAFLPLTQSDIKAAIDNEPDLTPMSWIAVRKVLELDLPSTEKFVLLIIANFSNDKEGTAWPAQTTIAQITGFSRQTVNKAIKRLCDKKVLLSSRRSA